MAVTVCGIAIVYAQGLLQTHPVTWRLTEFFWTTPNFTWQAMVSIGILFFIIALASQNLPGLAILQAAGYPPPA